MKTVAQIIIDTLVANGVDRAFCVPGESYLPVLDALLDETSIDLVTCRHEGSAGYMAITDARLSGRPGICLVSRGPGATNAAIAMHSAEQDCLPFILLVGQVPRRNLRRNAFQEIDYGKMFAGIAKWTAEIADASRTAEIMTHAFHAAMSGTPGPVVIAMPEDVLEEIVPSATVPPPYRTPHSLPAPSATQSVATYLKRSRRPLLIAGGRLATAEGRDALLSVVERWQIPTVVSFRRQDLFPNGHPLYAGDLGLSTTHAQIEAFQSADLIIAAGLRLDDLTTQGFTFPDMPKARQPFVHIHDDPKMVGTDCVPDLAVICDPAMLLKDLSAIAPSSMFDGDSSWAPLLRDLHLAKSIWCPVTAPDGVVFGNVITALKYKLAKDCIVVADAGLSAAHLYQYVEFQPPQMLLGTFVGTMGCGVANAIAASLRSPQRQVLCVAGDGGFIMSANELGIATARKLPIRFILATNGCYGSIRRDQEKTFPGRVVGTSLLNPNFQVFAQSFGCEAFLIDDETKIEAVLSEAFAVTGPSLVEVKASVLAAMPDFRPM